MDLVNFFWGGWKITKLVLSIFRDNLLQQSQLWILFNSKLTFVSRDSKDDSAKNKLESSANR